MITPIAFENIGYQTYIIFAAINAAIVPTVYFFFPETAYRSLEEMDTIFQKVSGWRGALDVVHQAKVEPRRYGKNGELLLTVDQVDEKGSSEHRGGSGSDSDLTAGQGMFVNGDEETQRGGR